MTQRAVITGMGVVSPVGQTVEDFWESVRLGRCGIDRITRFDPHDMPCRLAAEIHGFDPEAFLDTKAAKRMADFARYAAASALMAWRAAGLEEAASRLDMARVAVIIGNGIGGNEVDYEAHQRLLERGPRRMPALTIPKVIVNEGAGNISMLLGAKGVAHTVVTACASGTDAMGVALDHIRSGRADIVLTGGTEAAITRYSIGAFCALKALSTRYNDTPKVASRPFDRDRDGFVMGEGAGILVLESLEHALDRGAPILAELAGYGGTADAYHLTAPDPEGAGAARAFRNALADAGMQPDEVDYINAHGTSTPVNDPIETKAIKAALGDHACRVKVSSTKGVTGHCIGGGGGLEAVCCVLAIRDGICPPTINLENPDPECDLDYVPKVAQSHAVRVALSSSLGFGGHNGVVALKRFEE
jgi:3-oxoacyl-[acyl-carrier-protein] synthase II